MPENSNEDPLDLSRSLPDLNEYLQKFRLRENGGRRLGIDRRQFRYTLQIPEGRSGFERRVGQDRRKAPRIGSRLTLSHR